MWRLDIEFGLQRLIRCNPTQLRLFTEVPEKYVNFLHPISELQLEYATSSLYTDLFVHVYDYLRIYSPNLIKVSFREETTVKRILNSKESS